MPMPFPYREQALEVVWFQTGGMTADSTVAWEREAQAWERGIALLYPLCRHTGLPALVQVRYRACGTGWPSWSPKTTLTDRRGSTSNFAGRHSTSFACPAYRLEIHTKSKQPIICYQTSNNASDWLSSTWDLTSHS